MTTDTVTKIIEQLEIRKSELVYVLRSNEKQYPLLALSSSHDKVRDDIKEIDKQIQHFKSLTA